MYVCGITPYDYCHLGHARCYVAFDVIRRSLQRFGYQVTYVQNFTDIDDKIINRAKELKEDPKTLAERYIQDYETQMNALNVLPADRYPRVTGHIPEIQGLIAKLMEKEMAYAVGTGVYYAVRKFKEYGKLSNRTLDDMKVGARVEGEADKRDPLDFALWKVSRDPNELAWESPWGRGRPGWHIECSAMSMKYLGEDFDVHGGGQDLTFPHHENEIAQSCGATGKGFAHVWLHNGFVNVNKEKMSKSSGNFFTLKDVLKKHDPMAVRYFLLSQHYRSPIDYSEEALRGATETWRRIVETYRSSASLNSSGLEDTSPAFKAIVGDSEGDFFKALADDFNTPRALAAVHGIANSFYKESALRARTVHRKLGEMLDVLGFAVPAEEKWSAGVLDLAKRREEARKAKDWAGSDRLRDELRQQGVSVEDTSEGPRLRKIR